MKDIFGRNRLRFRFRCQLNGCHAASLHEKLILIMCRIATWQTVMTFSKWLSNNETSVSSRSGEPMMSHRCHAISSMKLRLINSKGDKCSPCRCQSERFHVVKHIIWFSEETRICKFNSQKNRSPNRNAHSSRQSAKSQHPITVTCKWPQMGRMTNTFWLWKYIEKIYERIQ